jgi:hypothetical protein
MITRGVEVASHADGSVIEGLPLRLEIRRRGFRRFREFRRAEPFPLSARVVTLTP